jgi:hypothetical protein
MTFRKAIQTATPRVDRSFAHLVKVSQQHPPQLSRNPCLDQNLLLDRQFKVHFATVAEHINGDLVSMFL